MVRRIVEGNEGCSPPPIGHYRAATVSWTGGQFRLYIQAVIKNYFEKPKKVVF